ncbi:MAG: hypothetical protein KIS87_13850, partial [Phycisphaeraceae bacterium]|nr:hypothetical protein [Phycisphaeraceae bacterium]
LQMVEGLRQYIAHIGAVLVSAMPVVPQLCLPGCGSSQRPLENTSTLERSRTMNTQDIKDEYSGTIDAASRGQGALDSLKRVSVLMSQWNPIFSTKDDVIEIMGVPTQATDAALVYRFDSGRFSAEWQFHLAGNRVFGVRFVPGH